MMMLLLFGLTVYGTAGAKAAKELMAWMTEPSAITLCLEPPERFGLYHSV